MGEPKRTKNFSTNEQDEDGQPKHPTAANTDEGEVLVASSRTSFQAEILPSELWEIIFKKIASDRDLLNCWNTCPTWANALRTTDFFFKMTLPFLLPYLRGKDLLRCSGVSKSWNSTIDAFMQNAEEYESDQNIKPNQRLQLKLMSSTLPGYIRRLNLSNDNSRGNITVVNPAAFRRVVFWLLFPVNLTRNLRWGLEDPERALDPFSFDQTNLLTFLRRYGYLLRYLHISISGENVPFLNKLRMIRNCLEHTPNLRSLKISPCYLEGSSISQNVLDLKLFNDHISENPWPALEHLKILRLSDPTFKKGYVSIANAYASKLVYLKLGFIFKQPDLPQNRFACLQEIVYGFSNYANSGAELEAFVRSSQCPLKHLTIVFRNDPNADNINGLTMAVNAASATIETLVFRPPGKITPNFKSDIKQFKKLQLPGLKVLKLSSWGYPSLKFLESVCPALQELILVPVIGGGGYMNRTKKHTGIYSNLYSQHHFWAQLTQIQRVDVKHLCETRHILVDDVVTAKLIGEEIVRKVFTRSEYQTKK